MSTPALDSAALTMPSRKGLLLRLFGSLLAALVIVFGFVLPAEYQMDPTGFGKLVGLTQMGQGPKTLANTTAAHSYDKIFTTHDTELTLVPGQSFEYKVRMKEGGTLIFNWKSSDILEYDFHGEADNKPDEATSYKAGNGKEENGSLIAPVQGIHGWYWKNNTTKPVDITLKMAGNFELKEEF